MRRAQTMRDTHSASLSPVDDLSVFLESSGEQAAGSGGSAITPVEASLRAEIFDKDRENDRLLDQILALQAQLAQRPPLAAIQALENEKRTLEMILQGTQRENEKMMTEVERRKKREAALEAELRNLCGDGWQTSLNITSIDASPTLSTLSPSITMGGANGSRFHPSASIATFGGAAPRRMSMILPPSLTSPGSVSDLEKSSDIPSTAEPIDDSNEQDRDSIATLQRTNALLANQLENVRLLVLGMDQRLVEREEKLIKALDRAEQENKALEARLKGFELASGVKL